MEKFSDRIRARIAVGFVVLGLSCAQQQSEVPRVAPSHVMNLAYEALPVIQPFHVVHSGPRGEAQVRPTIQVVFSRPVRALATDAALPSGLTLKPSVPGQWQWLGTQAIVFSPEGGELPLATKFRVRVPKGLSALDGQILAQEHEFEFETPRPKVVGASPTHYYLTESRDAPIHVVFNQAVEPSIALAHFEAKVAGKQVPVRAARSAQPGEVVFTPIEKWPVGATVEYVVHPGVLGQVGDLPSNTSHRETFGVHGPLVARVVCERNHYGHCRPGSYLAIEFSNPVPALPWAKALSADGYKLNVDTSFGSEERTHSLALAPNLAPGDTFALKFAPGVRDIHGQPLASFADHKVLVGDFSPQVTVGFSGDSVPRTERFVPILSRNTAYELATSALTPEQVSLLSTAEQKWATFALSAKTKRVRVPLKAKNELARELVDLDQLLAGTGGYGAFAVGVRFTGEDGQEVSEVRWGQRTNLAVSAKLGRSQSQVWVTDLASGRPVPGATVSLVAGGSQVATSAADGLARLPNGTFTSQPNHDGPSRFLVVRAGQDQALRRDSDAVDGYRIPVETDFYGESSDVAYLFPERDLFRPGESLWVKAYVRRPSVAGSAPVQAHNYQLTLSSGEGELLQTLKLATNRFGALAGKLTIPRAAQLGYFNLALRDGDTVLANRTVQVAEFSPAEFQVALEPSVPAIVQNGTASFQVEGSYMYGAPMTEARVHASLFHFAAEFKPQGSEGWITDNYAALQLEDSRAGGPYIGEVEATLDVHGQAVVPVSADFAHVSGPERLEIEAEVTDVTSRAQSGRASILVHPAEYYVALKEPDSAFAKLGEVIAPEVRALTPDGTDVADRPIALELIRIRYAEVERKTYAGESSTVVERIDEVVGRCRAMARGHCGLKPLSPGYHLVRATSQDRRGRRTRSSYSLYVLGAGDSGFRQSDERGSVELRLDRATYRVGEKARILVLSPFERARAWLTIERDDVIESRIVELEGRTPSIELPVTAALRPNVHVGVLILEDRASVPKAHPLAEAYRFGYVDLNVDPEEQRLRLMVTADQPSYRPRGTVTLKLATQDALGRPMPAEVTLFVVDEGVLSLSGYAMPDPLLAFTRPEPLRVETIESRESIARFMSLDPNQFANKGEPGGGGDEGRSNFLTTAYFNPSLITDDAGLAEVSFSLPDNVGRFRVMALGVSSGDQYGRGEASLMVNKELMMRPQLPRFLRAGDSFIASTVVSSLSERELDVAVDFLPKNLNVTGATEKAVRLLPRASERIDFEAHSSQAGAATFTFDGRAGGLRDKVSVTRAVQSPAAMEVVSAYGKTESAVAEQLGSLSGVRTEVGSLELTLSSSALVGLEGGYDELIEYPYECTEQLSSRVLPLIAFGPLARRFGFTAPKDARGRIERDVSQIVRRQHGDGGFGLWSESPKSEPWVSPYAFWVLSMAKKAGYFVPEDVLNRGEQFLMETARDTAREHLPFATFAEFVLGQVGKADPARLNVLSDQRRQLPQESRAFLLWAAASAGHKSVQAELLPELESSLTPRGNRVELASDTSMADPRGFSSAVRTQAIVLGALLMAAPNHPLAAGLARGLLDARRGGSWGSTQESAFALLALDAYQKAQESKTPSFSARAFLAGKAVFAPEFKGFERVAQKMSFPVSALQEGTDLIFDKQGSGTLFYETRLRYARSELPKEPREAGFSVSKTLRRLTREELTRPLGEPRANSSDFTEGDLVLVDLVVLASDQRRYVVVEDPLPAGFEAIDFSLSTSANGLSPEFMLASGYSWSWYRSELRDDRSLFFVDDMPAGLYRYAYVARATTSGRFVTPPTVVREMYQEEVMGRTGSTVVQIHRASP